MSLGPMEIMAILVVALIVFGPKRLPEVGRQVGAAMRELRRIQDTVKAEIRDAMAEPTPAGPAAGSTDHAAIPPEVLPERSASESGDPSGGFAPPRSFS